ncbi:hypothetical protein OG577_33480 [Streptomyces canus]
MANKRTVVPSDDPVEDLRAGWHTQIDFGPANPYAYGLLLDPARARKGGVAAGSGLGEVAVVLAGVLGGRRLVVGHAVRGGLVAADAVAVPVEIGAVVHVLTGRVDRGAVPRDANVT